MFAHSWRNDFICALGVVIVALTASPAHSEIRRTTKSAGYRQCWAVVIGINYRHLEGAAAQEIPPLDTAEQDATAIHEALLANYGYSAENTKLLLGKDATREGIRQLLGESFLGDRERVTKDDAVVFYFAGHGNRREKVTADQQYVGLLYPSDLRVLPGKGVDTVSCLQIRELLDCLRDLCPARHKLLILDSCHSGEVFNLKSNRSAGVNREFQPTLFHQPAFEAISAAGAGQKAGDQDATGEHSPFTRALLDALQHGPNLSQPRPFTASELFAYIPDRLATMPGVKQNPRGGWLDGEGDFYFFPRHLLPPKDLAEFETLATVRGIPDASAENASTEAAGSRSLAWLWVGAGVVVPLVAGTVTLAVRRRRRSTPRAESAMLVPIAGPLVYLHVVGSPFAYQSLPGAARITVGRQRRKPGQAAEEGNDLVVRLPDENGGTLRISRRQIEIDRVGEQYFVTDRSTHGTRLNGDPLVKDQRTPLKSADRLNLSDVVTLEVQIRTNRLGGAVAPFVQAAMAEGRPQPLVIEASVGDMQTI